MEVYALSPEEFVGRFRDSPKFIHAFLETEYHNESERQILLKIISGKAVSQEEYQQLSFTFRSGIIAVYDRIAYACNCQQRKKEHLVPKVAFPLVDKNMDLVFEVQYGVHLFVKDQILQATEPGYASIFDTGAYYILQGKGYFCSRATNKGIAIGKKLFEKNALDEYDETILSRYKIALIETEEDFKKLKGRY